MTNDLLNFPVITSAVASGGTVTVTYDLDVPANPDQYRVEFFANPSGADGSGNGEGETFVSAITAAPGAGLTHNFSGSAGDVITATATRIDTGAASGHSSTSEFSAAATVTAAPDPVVLDNVQKGTATLANASSTVAVTIASVDPSKAFLTFSVRGNDTSPENISISGRLSNATTVTFDRVGTSGNVVIDWSVVEFSSGVTVQRGTVTPGGSTTNVAITSVDLTRSFPLVSMRAGGVIYEGEDWVRARFTSSTDLELATTNTFGNVIEWQVVTYNDATVQSGSVSFGTGDSSRTATVTALDPAKSWLIYNYRTTDGTTTNIGQKLVRGRITNGTTLTFDRSSTGQTIDLQYFVVKFTDATEVRSGNANFTSSATTVNAAVTAVDPARSIGVGGYAQTGGRSSYTANDNPGVGWFTSRLTSSTNLRVQRSAALAGADLGWFVMHWPGPAAPLLVNSTGNASDTTPGDGYCTTGANNSQGMPECTLRAAIQEANTNAYVDTIDFNIPTTDGNHDSGAGTWTISPGSALPTLTRDGLTIDAQSQPGTIALGRPQIELRGGGAGGGVSGLTIDADNVTIRGLAIGSFNSVGIYVINTSTGTVIAGNHIGLDAEGTSMFGNGSHGIILDTGTSGATIGGTAAADRNVISGNGNRGIFVLASNNNTIVGNRIGTDLTGLIDLGNATDGIGLETSSSDNVIGQPGAGNVISGNTEDGVEIDRPSNRNLVQANLIGVGLDGATSLPNGRYGVVLYDGAADNEIGGGGAGEGNTISSSGSHGVVVDGNNNAATAGNTIAGNIIGLTADVSAPRPNTGGGVVVFGGPGALTIGGTAAGAGNTIASNGGDGIEVTGAATSSVSVLGNDLRSNGGLGIDLAGNGVTNNDGGDGDSGPNDLLNFPVLTTPSAGATTIDVDLDVPAGDYRIEVFTNATAGADPSGNGEGETPVHAETITHTGSGVESFTLTGLSPAFTAGDVVTATATEDLGGGSYGPTSEFSAARTVVTGLLGRWRFDEGSGSTALDSSGAGYDGTITGATYTTGLSSTALDFTGNSGERVVVGDPVDGSLDPGTGDFTVSAWFRTTQLPGSGDFDQLVYKSDGGEGYELFLTDDGGVTRLSFRIRDGGASWTALDVTPLDDGVWHHAAGVIDGTDIHLYLDGILVATQPHAATDIDTTESLAFGADAAGPAWSDYEGELDEIAIYGRALSAGEIATLATPPGGSTTVTFQEGTDGYTGTVDTWVSSIVADQDNSAQTSIDVDNDAYQQGLIRFASIVGAGAGQIPSGATVTSATLTLVNDEPTSPGATLSLHRVLRSWVETDTWNTLASGISIDGVEAAVAPDATYSGAMDVIDTSATITGLEAAVQAWVDGDPNRGWLIVIDSNNGLDIRSSENATVAWRPSLEVTYSTAPVPPVAVDDSADTSVDTNVVIDVLANDTDGNGDTLTVQSVTQGTNGTVVNNGTDVTYSPNASWTGVDTFTYTVSDGNGGTDTATVTVTVNDGPTGLWLSTASDVGSPSGAPGLSSWSAGSLVEFADPGLAFEPPVDVGHVLHDRRPERSR